MPWRDGMVLQVLVCADPEPALGWRASAPRPCTLLLPNQTISRDGSIFTREVNTTSSSCRSEAPSLRMLPSLLAG